MGAVLHRVVKESVSNKVTSEQHPEAREEKAKWITGKGFQTEGIRVQTFSGSIWLTCSKRAQRLVWVLLGAGEVRTGAAHRA